MIKSKQGQGAQGWLRAFIVASWMGYCSQSNAFTFQEYLAQGDNAAKSGDIGDALKAYGACEQANLGDASNLCVLTKSYCDLMRSTTSPAIEKTLAGKALACAQNAVNADPSNATAHICVAIGYAKDFPYTDNHNKILFSRLIKSECERAIQLDPKQDIAYYLLARWNFGVANMNWLYKGFVRIIYGGLPVASDMDAIADLKKAIQLRPERIIHHAELGKEYLALGEVAKARDQLTLCARLKPLDDDDADAQNEAAQALATLKP